MKSILQKLAKQKKIKATNKEKANRDCLQNNYTYVDSYIVQNSYYYKQMQFMSRQQNPFRNNQKPYFDI